MAPVALNRQLSEEIGGELNDVVGSALQSSAGEVRQQRRQLGMRAQIHLGTHHLHSSRTTAGRHNGREITYSRVRDSDRRVSCLNAVCVAPAVGWESE